MKQITLDWLNWLKKSIDTTIEAKIVEVAESKENINVNWLTHYITESIELDLGKFRRGLTKEIRGG
jgi:hypothetical protein